MNKLFMISFVLFSTISVASNRSYLNNLKTDRSDWLTYSCLVYKYCDGNELSNTDQEYLTIGKEFLENTNGENEIGMQYSCFKLRANFMSNLWMLREDRSFLSCLKRLSERDMEEINRYTFSPDNSFPFPNKE